MRTSGAWMTLLAVLCASALPARADDLSCVSTTFRLVGKNDRVCVSAFDDPKVAGVACHISQARTGGLSGTIGLAEDPSRFSIACRQIGPISTDLASLKDGEEVYSARTSIFFKRTHVYRMLDTKRNTLVYLAISDKLIDGSPQNPFPPSPSCRGARVELGREHMISGLGLVGSSRRLWSRTGRVSG